MKSTQYTKLNIAELEKANRVINQFVTSCSHSMRGPLKSIKGLVSLLYKSKDIPEWDATKFLDLIEESAYKMENMLDELEQLLENSKRGIAIKKIDWGELIKSVLTRYQKEIITSQIKVDFTIEQLADFSSDRLRLYLILSHIVENAIQFQDKTKSDRTIHISVQAKALDCVIHISDNGIGIDNNAQGKVFDLFYRATEKSKGVGVGLYVVREAIEKMGGSITAESELGTGSVFILTITNMVAAKKGNVAHQINN